MGTFFSLISIPLSLLAIVGLLRQGRGEQIVQRSSLIVGLLMAPATLAINLVFLRQAAPASIGWLVLALGLGFGLVWGRSLQLSRREGAITGKKSGWYFIFWLASLAITQLLVLVAPASWVSTGLVLMFFSAGSSMGYQGNILRRWLKINLAK
jgi:hypothetical protein